MKTTEDGDDKAATILLVEEDDDTRPVLKRNLIREGYHVIVALDVEDALERTRDGAARANLLLVNVVDVPVDDALESARLIHMSAGYDGETPIVVIAEKYGPELEGLDVTVGDNEYVTYMEDAEQLHNLLARLVYGDADSNS